MAGSFPFVPERRENTPLSFAWLWRRAWWVITPSWGRNWSSLRFLVVPVSEELGVFFDVSIPGGVPEKGVKREFRSLGDLRPRKQDRDISEMAEGPQVEKPKSQYKQPVVELSSYRLAAVEAGRQPSYGKRVTLIADGLDSPDSHLAKARCLKHPFQEEHVIKPDHRKALMTLKVKGNSISQWRLKQLAKMKALVESTKSSQSIENRSSSWTAKKLGNKPKTETPSKGVPYWRR